MGETAQSMADLRSRANFGSLRLLAVTPPRLKVGISPVYPYMARRGASRASHRAVRWLLMWDGALAPSPIPPARRDPA
jgi:hypothetical protein